MIIKLYKKITNWILKEEATPVYVFNCTSLVWVSNIRSTRVRHNEWRCYFYLSFCSGLQVKVFIDTDSDHSEHLSNIRKLFINAIGHSYLPLYEAELTIGDSAVKLTEKKIDD